MGYIASDDVLKRYLEDIRKTAPISRKEEQYLFVLAKQGNSLAREKIVSSNMRFVLKVALRYKGCKIPLQDLISEGSMGLMRAIESFDHTRGLKFISYAVWWIKAYITRAINEQGNLIRLPANQHLRIKKAMRTARVTGELSDDVRYLMQLSEGGASFDDPISQEDSRSLGDAITDESSMSPEAEVEISQIDENLLEIIKQLPKRESQVLRSLYGIEHESSMNLREVGENLNISHERVRQLRDQALRRIRRMTYSENLQEKFTGYLKAQHSVVQ
ncbi:MAG: sigma-70 family RNA polymerase sigma factor [Fibrobacter sp.]|nr:sigma-70 family RNA polymerase sigma factor [Fibrobacter sp.]